MDPRLNLRKRQKAEEGPLKSKFEAAILEITAAFKKTAGFQHAQTKGNEREIPVRSLFKEYLPEAFATVGGEIIDANGQHSRQTDAIVYNHHRNRAFASGGSCIIAAEAALLTVEVKTKLDAGELAACVEAAAQLKSLKLFGRALAAPREHGKPADDEPRIFHSVFAYNADLTEEDWGKKEYERLQGICAKNKLPLHLIDRLYVADRGLILPAKGIGLFETPQTGVALMHFLLHAINFCVREDKRRPSVDYVNYASSATKEWVKLS